MFALTWPQCGVDVVSASRASAADEISRSMIITHVISVSDPHYITDGGLFLRPMGALPDLSVVMVTKYDDNLINCFFFFFFKV